MRNSSNEYSQMRDALKQWVEFDDGQWEKLTAIFQLRQLPRQHHILLPGDKVYDLIFVSEGLLRFYYPTEDGGESNKAFISADMFAGPLAASVLELPVMYGIETLEPTTLLAASYRDFSQLFDQDPLYDRLGRKLAEWLLVRKELRARSLLQQSAAERYLHFVEQHPDLLQRIPQYHIASFLGITEVSLSRLKKNLLKNPIS